MTNRELSQIINHLLDKPTRPYQKFQEVTKIKKSPKPIHTSSQNGWKDISYKAYPRLPHIFLPPAQSMSDPFLSVLKKRASSRLFGKDPLSLETLSTLLSYTFGIKDEKTHTRFYPSAGARYPLEAYVIALNSDIPKGLYHYNVKSHTLERLVTFSTFDMKKYFISSSWMEAAGCIIILSALFDRTIIKYGERGYRHVLQEAGAVMQTAYLVATAFSLSMCAVGGYKDNQLNTFLDIDGVHESVVGTLICGHPLTES